MKSIELLGALYDSGLSKEQTGYLDEFILNNAGPLTKISIDSFTDYKANTVAYHLLFHKNGKIFATDGNCAMQIPAEYDDAFEGVALDVKTKKPVEVEKIYDIGYLLDNSSRPIEVYELDAERLYKKSVLAECWNSVTAIKIDSFHLSPQYAKKLAGFLKGNPNATIEIRRYKRKDETDMRMIYAYNSGVQAVFSEYILLNKANIKIFDTGAYTL